MAAAVYAGQFDRWEGKPTISCTSCNQSTGDIDRHSADDKPKYLLWTQARRTKASAEFAAAAATAKGKQKGEVDVDDRFPSGSECYPCYDVRRKFYPGMSQEELNTLRSNTQETDDEFNERRSDNVSEGGKFKGNLAKFNTIEKGENPYDKKYISGTAAKLWDFARMRHLHAQSDDELV